MPLPLAIVTVFQNITWHHLLLLQPSRGDAWKGPRQCTFWITLSTSIFTLSLVWRTVADSSWRNHTPVYPYRCKKFDQTTKDREEDYNCHFFKEYVLGWWSFELARLLLTFSVVNIGPSPPSFGIEVHGVPYIYTRWYETVSMRYLNGYQSSNLEIFFFYFDFEVHLKFCTCPLIHNSQFSQSMVEKTIIVLFYIALGYVFRTLSSTVLHPCTLPVHKGSKWVLWRSGPSQCSAWGRPPTVWPLGG